VNGIDLTKSCATVSHVPIIVISARGVKRKVTALDAGADDYLTKPFSVNELLARMRVAQRHAHGPESAPQAQFTSSAHCASTWRGAKSRSRGETRTSPRRIQLPRDVFASRGQGADAPQILKEVWGSQLRHADPLRPSADGRVA